MNINKTYKVIYGLLILLIFISCSPHEKKLFKLKTNTDIDFNNELSPTPDLNILTYLYYYNGAGVATGDFNNDGLMDLYFTGNQVQDKLYLNKGDFQFEDITLQAGIDNLEGWTNGVTLVDINNDKLLDIYICKVGKYQNIKGQNLLYINQGNKENGSPSFKEEAKSYNLNIISFATQSSFFDYDLDGDLDMYLMNHSIYPNRTYGKGNQRKEVDSLSGDKLFKNENGKFIEISQEAGIFQGIIGYGLGISISDLNNDGYPDIYIGNDFFENDYLYINQKNGTFEEIISKNTTNLGHTSQASMGNDMADINNDGLTDIVSLDMLPENIETYKTAGSEYSNQIYDQYLKKGYRAQFTQNTLHLNLGNTKFSEIGFASGIVATDWSWAPLIADLDNDGYKDIFISNGIKGATNDMDFINFIANEKIQKRINQGMNQEDMSFTDEIPEKKLSNFFFKNNANLTFSNYTEEWFRKILSFSNGAVYVDLDNDGDLDIVTNNVNDKAYIIENRSEIINQNNYLRIKFEGSPKNTLGIGAKVIVHLDSLTISNENFLTRGYLSSISPDMTIGIGKNVLADSLTVIWPGGKFQTLRNIRSNTSTVCKYIEASGNYYSKDSPNKSLLINVKSPINYKHNEHPSYEFNREPLMPYAKGHEGPKITIGDVNADGLDDIFIGGAKKQLGALYTQDNNGNFSISLQDDFEISIINEDTDNLFFDADNDGDQDLLVVSGGNEFKSGAALNPKLYLNEKGKFNLSNAFKNIEINASVVRSFDFDNDGDHDIVMGANVLPQQFGKSAKNYIFENDGNGNFKDISATKAIEFSNIGLIEDIEIIDINDDQLLDMIVVGHWMPISIFINDGKYFKLQSNNLKQTNGWWNTIKSDDFDKDGDIDFIVGNWGLNTRLKASIQEPVQLYRNDFDNNGKIEQIVTYFSQGKETVFSSKDELTKQLPILNKKFLSYTEFARTDFSGLFNKEKIKNAYNKQVYELASCYFENTGNGEFKKKKLPFLAQTSSIKTLCLSDFDGDGYQDILIAGNDYEISTQLGRLDAFHGILLLNDQEGFFTIKTNQSFDISGPARDIEKIKINGIAYFIVSINNNTPVFLRNNR
ncbi:MAG: VCBS repeat-containing protein [Bacteroidota bacterium]